MSISKRRNVYQAALKQLNAIKYGCTESQQVISRLFPDINQSVQQLRIDISTEDDSLQKFALETATYILAGRFSVSRVPDAELVKLKKVLQALLEASQSQEVVIKVLQVFSRQHMPAAVVHDELPGLVEAIAAVLKSGAPWLAPDRRYHTGILALARLHEQAASLMASFAGAWLPSVWQHVLDFAPADNAQVADSRSQDLASSHGVVSAAALELVGKVIPAVSPMSQPLLRQLARDLIAPPACFSGTLAALQAETPGTAEPCKLLAVMHYSLKGKNVKDMPAAIQAWTYVVRLMGRDIMFRSREIVNPMLKMMEGPLTIMSQQPQLAAPALHAWQCLVDAFAMAGQMRVPKRVDLLARPMYHALMLSSKEVVQQEAIKCWSHLIKVALCKPEEASDEKLAVLITPMLLKVLGNGRGMASASGSIPSASQTPKYDIPLKHSCTVLVLKGLQGLQQPSLIARLAEDLTSHVLDSLWMDEASNRDLSNGILPAMAELLCSWLRLLAEVHAAPVGSAQALPDPEQLPQVLAALDRYWTSLLAHVLHEGRASSPSAQGRQLPHSFLPFLSAAYAAHGFAQPGSTTPAASVMSASLPHAEPSAMDAGMFAARAISQLIRKIQKLGCSRGLLMMQLYATGIEDSGKARQTWAFFTSLWCRCCGHVDPQADCQLLIRHTLLSGRPDWGSTWWQACLEALAAPDAPLTSISALFSPAPAPRLHLWLQLACHLAQAADELLTEDDGMDAASGLHACSSVCSQALLTPFELLAGGHEEAAGQAVDSSEVAGAWRKLHSLHGRLTDWSRQQQVPDSDPDGVVQPHALTADDFRRHIIAAISAAATGASPCLLELGAAAALALLPQAAPADRRQQPANGHQPQLLTPSDTQNLELFVLLLTRLLPAEQEGNQPAGLIGSDRQALAQRLLAAWPAVHGSSEELDALLSTTLPWLQALLETGSQHCGLPQALVSSVWTSLLPLVRVGLAQHSRNSSELPTCTPALLAVLPSALQHPTAAIAQSALGFCNSEAFLQKVQAAGLQPPAAVSEALCKAEACLLDSKPRKAQQFSTRSPTPAQLISPTSHAADESLGEPTSARARPVPTSYSSRTSSARKAASKRKSDSSSKHMPSSKRLSSLFEPTQTEYVKIDSAAKARKLLTERQKSVNARQRRGPGREGVVTYTGLDASQDAWSLQQHLATESQRDSPANTGPLSAAAAPPNIDAHAIEQPAVPHLITSQPHTAQGNQLDQHNAVGINVPDSGEELGQPPSRHQSYADPSDQPMPIEPDSPPQDQAAHTVPALSSAEGEHKLQHNNQAHAANAAAAVATSEPQRKRAAFGQTVASQISSQHKRPRSGSISSNAEPDVSVAAARVSSSQPNGQPDADLAGVQQAFSPEHPVSAGSAGNFGGESPRSVVADSPPPATPSPSLQPPASTAAAEIAVRPVDSPLVAVHVASSAPRQLSSESAHAQPSKNMLEANQHHSSTVADNLRSKIHEESEARSKGRLGMKHQPCSASAPNQVPVEESGDRSPASARQPMQTVPHQQPADTACDSLLLLHQQGSHAKRTPSPEDAQAPGSIDEANKSIGKLLDSWAGLEDGQAGKVREVQDSKDEKEPSAPKQSRRLTFDSTADQPAMVQTTSSDRQQAAAANLTACEHGQQLSQEPDAAMVLDTEVAEACNDTGVGSLLPSSSRERTEAPELEGLMEAEGKMQEAHEHVPGGLQVRPTSSCEPPEQQRAETLSAANAVALARGPSDSAGVYHHVADIHPAGNTDLAALEAGVRSTCHVPTAAPILQPSKRSDTISSSAEQLSFVQHLDQRGKLSSRMRSFFRDETQQHAVEHQQRLIHQGPKHESHVVRHPSQAHSSGRVATMQPVLQPHHEIKNDGPSDSQLQELDLSTQLQGAQGIMPHAHQQTPCSQHAQTTIADVHPVLYSQTHSTIVANRPGALANMPLESQPAHADQGGNHTHAVSAVTLGYTGAATADELIQALQQLAAAIACVHSEWSRL